MKVSTSQADEWPALELRLWKTVCGFKISVVCISLAVTMDTVFSLT